MKQYILTCINENKEVVSTQAFATLSEAQEQMKREYANLVNEAGVNSMWNKNLEYHSANIYYGDNLEYHWEISSIDMPEAPFSTIARNLYFIFRDDFENSSDVRRLALFKAIFGEDMGEHIYKTKWRDDRHYDFISSLDGDNIKKFADFLLDYHKYRHIANQYYWHDEVVKDLKAIGASSIDLCRVEAYSKFPNVGVGYNELRWVGLDANDEPRFESNNVHVEGTDPTEGVYEEYTWDELSDAEKEEVRQAIRAYRKAKGSNTLLP